MASPDREPTGPTRGKSVSSSPLTVLNWRVKPSPSGSRTSQSPDLEETSISSGTFSVRMAASPLALAHRRERTRPLSSRSPLAVRICTAPNSPRSSTSPLLVSAWMSS